MDSFVGALFEFGVTSLTAESPNGFAVLVLAYLHVRGEYTTTIGQVGVVFHLIHN